MFRFIKEVFNRKEREPLDALRKYQTVYNTPEGKWVLEDILKMCNYGGSCLGKDDKETYFKIGEQNIGLEISQRLNADIAQLEEASQKEETTDEQN